MCQTHKLRVTTAFSSWSLLPLCVCFMCARPVLIVLFNKKHVYSHIPHTTPVALHRERLFVVPYYGLQQRISSHDVCHEQALSLCQVHGLIFSLFSTMIIIHNAPAASFCISAATWHTSPAATLLSYAADSLEGSRNPSAACFAYGSVLHVPFVSIRPLAAVGDGYTLDAVKAVAGPKVSLCPTQVRLLYKHSNRIRHQSLFAGNSLYIRGWACSADHGNGSPTQSQEQGCRLLLPAGNLASKEICS